MAAASGDRAVCAVTLYSPYWLDNRTGLDLDFQVGFRWLGLKKWSRVDVIGGLGHSSGHCMQFALHTPDSHHCRPQRVLRIAHIRRPGFGKLGSRVCTSAADIDYFLLAGCAVGGSGAGVPCNVGLQCHHCQRCRCPATV